MKGSPPVRQTLLTLSSSQIRSTLSRIWRSPYRSQSRLKAGSTAYSVSHGQPGQRRLHPPNRTKHVPWPVRGPSPWTLTYISEIRTTSSPFIAGSSSWSSQQPCYVPCAFSLPPLGRCVHPKLGSGSEPACSSHP